MCWFTPQMTTVAGRSQAGARPEPGMSSASAMWVAAAQGALQCHLPRHLTTAGSEVEQQGPKPAPQGMLVLLRIV